MNGTPGTFNKYRGMIHSLGDKMSKCLAISSYESLFRIVDWFLMSINYSHARCLHTYPPEFPTIQTSQISGMLDLNEEITNRLQEYENCYVEPDHRVHLLLTEHHRIIPDTWNAMPRSVF